MSQCASGSASVCGSVSVCVILSVSVSVSVLVSMQPLVRTKSRPDSSVEGGWLVEPVPMILQPAAARHFPFTLIAHKPGHYRLLRSL